MINEMEEIAEKLALYQTLFVGCFIGMIMSLAMSVSFFLRYRIWEMFGRKRKREKSQHLKSQKISRRIYRQRPHKNESLKTALLSFEVEQEVLWIHTKEEI